MKLSDAIFCDDIRYEINNKISLIGIYSDQINISFPSETEEKWPIPMRLAVLLRLTFEEKETKPDRFEFEYFMNGKSIIKMNEKLKVEKSQLRANLGLSGAGIPIELGDLGFSIKLFKEDKLLFSEENKEAIKILKK